MKYINQESLLAEVRIGFSWHSPKVVPISHPVALTGRAINHPEPLITDCGRAAMTSWANRTHSCSLVDPHPHGSPSCSQTLSR